MEVTVRPASETDLSLIVHFNVCLARDTEDTMLDRDTLTRGVTKVLGDPRRGVYFIAELGGRGVGCLMITREWSDWRDGWIWWIQSVYVVPEARRQGVYRALHACVLTRAREAGDVRGVRLYVDKQNRAAQAVYSASGMQPSRYDLYAQALDPEAVP